MSEPHILPRTHNHDAQRQEERLKAAALRSGYALICQSVKPKTYLVIRLDAPGFAGGATHFVAYQNGSVVCKGSISACTRKLLELCPPLDSRLCPRPGTNSHKS